MKDRFCPGVATGLPWTSKPLLAAVSCGEPGAGEPSGCVSCALGTGTAAGPGGGSSGPARPQAERARTAKLKRTKPDMRAHPLVPAKAGTQNWIPACAGMSGNLVRSQFKPNPSSSRCLLPQRNGRATLCRPNLAGALGSFAHFLGFLAEPLEPALRLSAHVARRRSAIDLPASDRIGHREHIEYRFRDPRLDRLHGLER
jgi:hypothetical protein